MMIKKIIPSIFSYSSPCFFARRSDNQNANNIPTAIMNPYPCTVTGPILNQSLNIKNFLHVSILSDCIENEKSGYSDFSSSVFSFSVSSVVSSLSSSTSASIIFPFASKLFKNLWNLSAINKTTKISETPQ